MRLTGKGPFTALIHYGTDMAFFSCLVLLFFWDCPTLVLVILFLKDRFKAILYTFFVDRTKEHLMNKLSCYICLCSVCVYVRDPNRLWRKEENTSFSIPEHERHFILL